MFQSRTAFEPVDLPADRRSRAFQIDIAGEMRGHEDLRMPPEGMRRRQWLGRKDVEAGATELAGFPRPPQIRVVGLRRAADIDQTGAWPEAAEQIRVQDALGLRSQRQQADQNLQPVQEGV